jgi:hypothetical protein
MPKKAPTTKKPPEYTDGPYREKDLIPLIYDHSEFATESELQSFVVSHANNIFGVNFDKIVTEITFPLNQPRKRSKFRLDVLAINGGDHYLIECKVPASNSIVQIISGVAQLQLYGIVYESAHGIKPKLILVCSKINEYLSTYMQKFASDITLFIVGKTYTIEMENGKTC